MSKVKAIAMYLPQYHRIPENDLFWGEGFTDWTSVKKAEKLYEGHQQPRIPLNENYYDLSQEQAVRWQVDLAKRYGLYGFGIYHYWFSSSKVVLTKPAEIILNNQDIDMPFFFAWDNVSWKRTWSKLKGNDWAPISDKNRNKHDGPEILIEYALGGESEWKAHFEYLYPFFKDDRYIRYNGKPVFFIYHYSQKIEEMGAYWNKLAQESGLEGVQLVFRYDSVRRFPEYLLRFTYEPIYSGWGGAVTRFTSRIMQAIGKSTLRCYDYDDVWKRLLHNAEIHDGDEFWHGAFVGYDDTPRRGDRGTVVTGGSPGKFGSYMASLLRICKAQNKEFVILTAWNEWGEGAYLEPDTMDQYGYVQALRDALIETGNL